MRRCVFFLSVWTVFAWFVPEQSALADNATVRLGRKPPDQTPPTAIDCRTRDEIEHAEKLADSDRFHYSKEECERHAVFAWNHYDWCKKHPEIASEDWATEAMGLAQCWGFLARAKETGNSDLARIEAMLEVRRLITDDAYMVGRMPPAVPVWRFRELKEK